MPVILTIFNARDLCVRRAHNQTDNDVPFSRSCDQGKITKEDLKIIMHF